MADYIKNYADSKSYYFHFYSVVSGEHVKFPALLTQLDDKFSPNWNPQKVFGRQDPILTFQGTERTMDVAFDVPSESKRQAKDNLVKLNKLIKFLYPGFSTQGSANTISASPLLRIKFANLIYDQSKGVTGVNPEEHGLVCGITNFSHSFKFDGTAGWVDEENSAIPASFSISFSATILHTHDLGFTKEDDGEQGAYLPDTEFPYYVSEADDEGNATEAASAAVDAATVLATAGFGPAVGPAVGAAVRSSVAVAARQIISGITEDSD
jgi:hypothetical protein